MNLNKETFMTFMGWVDKGRGVKKGEKAACFISVVNEDGSESRLGLFGRSQTVKLEYEMPTGRNSCWDGDMIYDRQTGSWMRQLCGPKKHKTPYPMPRM